MYIYYIWIYVCTSVATNSKHSAWTSVSISSRFRANWINVMLILFPYDETENLKIIRCVNTVFHNQIKFISLDIYTVCVYSIFLKKIYVQFGGKYLNIWIIFKVAQIQIRIELFEYSLQHWSELTLWRSGSPELKMLKPRRLQCWNKEKCYRDFLNYFQHFYLLK